MKPLFRFDDIDDFDRHINLSIPNYDGLHTTFSSMALEYMPRHGLCIDLGCSTGKFLSGIARDDAKYVGIDLVDMSCRHDGFEFVQGNVLEYIKKIEHCDVIVAMFMLQFLGELERRELIVELVRLVNNGACLLLSEKVFIDDPRVNQVIHREHMRFKLESFTADEILKKDHELLGSMFCKTNNQINEELSVFPNVSGVWQSYNFNGWCITN